MLLVRHIIASSANHCHAVFSPRATVLNTLYAMALQQEVLCEQHASHPHMELGRGRVILRDVMRRLFELWLCPEQEPDPRRPWHATKRLLS